MSAVQTVGLCPRRRGFESYTRFQPLLVEEVDTIGLKPILLQVQILCGGPNMPYADPEKQRKFQREWLHERRKVAQDYLGGKCVVCGSTSNLEFHHIDPSQKEKRIRPLLSCKWDKLKKELDKCELRCHEHHLEAHAAKHGSRTRYANGCRCELCLASLQYKREYMRGWRARQKTMATTHLVKRQV